MGDITVTLADEILNRYGEQLASFSNGEIARVATMALNTEGKKGRTRVNRALMAQTGIKSHSINDAVKNVEATYESLAFRIQARGYETNLKVFGARTVGKKNPVVVASPWNKRRQFPGTFQPKKGGNVFVRTSAARYPIRPVFGPNIARELTKDETAEAFGTIAPQVLNEFGRIVQTITAGTMKFTGTFGGVGAERLRYVKV